LARIFIRKANIIRARSIFNRSPTPAQCETIKRVCRSLKEASIQSQNKQSITYASLSSGIIVVANEPKPVFTP